MKIIQVTELTYAEDIVVLGNTKKKLQEIVYILIKHLKDLFMKYDKEKTKTLYIVGDGSVKDNIKMEGKDIELIYLLGRNYKQKRQFRR